jgi:hypothetical protein
MFGNHRTTGGLALQLAPEATDAAKEATQWMNSNILKENLSEEDFDVEVNALHEQLITKYGQSPCCDADNLDLTARESMDTCKHTPNVHEISMIGILGVHLSARKGSLVGMQKC